jgi:hypothetical protein
MLTALLVDAGSIGLPKSDHMVTFCWRLATPQGCILFACCSRPSESVLHRRTKLRGITPTPGSVLLRASFTPSFWTPPHNRTDHAHARDTLSAWYWSTLCPKTLAEREALLEILWKTHRKQQNEPADEYKSCEAAAVIALLNAVGPLCRVTLAQRSPANISPVLTQSYCRRG